LNLNWNQAHKNPTNQILVRITSQNKCKVDFINGQFESCPQTGKIHIQACIIAEKALSDEPDQGTPGGYPEWMRNNPGGMQLPRRFPH
jgi:hypothetical protein